MKTCWLSLTLALLPLASPEAGAQARPQIKVRIYPSIMVGTDKKTAVAVTRPLVDKVVAPRLPDADVDLDLADLDTSRASLVRFGRQLDRGDIDIGVVWGVEYGWLRSQFPGMRPAVYCSFGKAPQKSQLMVGPDLVGDIDVKDLRGKRLAIYPRMSFLESLFLDDLVQKEQGQVDQFFVKKRFLSCGDAAHAVNSGEADCIVLGIDAFAQLKNNVPGSQLRNVKVSETYSSGVLIGRPDLLEKKRPGAWKVIVQTLSEAHRNRQARNFLYFWRMESFIAADAEFEAQVQADVIRFPFQRLK